MLTGAQIIGLLKAVESEGLEKVVSDIKTQFANGKITEQQAVDCLGLAELADTFGSVDNAL